MPLPGQLAASALPCVLSSPATFATRIGPALYVFLVLCDMRMRTLQFMGFGMEYAPFIILYGIAFEWCYRTAGEPYAAAIAHEAAKKAIK